MKMKNKTLFVPISLALLVLTSSCREKTKAAEIGDIETVATAEENSETFRALPHESTITWSGYKPTGSHTGTIALNHGKFTVTDGVIESGIFTIDMASLKDSEGNARLEKHLKSEDFFEVEKHPESVFQVTGVETANGKTLLSGNLKMKDTTNNVTFPMTLIHRNDTIILRSEPFTIDRSKWNVRFGSKSFFKDLGEKYIDNDIELTIVVKASKE